jgi:hypothetical protein
MLFSYVSRIVVDKIYYVVHRFQSMSRAAIHLGVHNHLVVDGKCQKFIENTRRLITKEVDHMPDVKIFSISLSASNTFLVSYLLILTMAQWSSLMVSSWSTSMTSSMNLTLQMFITLLLLSSVIQEVAILMTSLN